MSHSNSECSFNESSSSESSESSIVSEVPPLLANDKHTIKEAYLSLRDNIERWVFQHIDEDIDLSKVFWQLNNTWNKRGVRPLTRTFKIVDEEEPREAFRDFVRHFSHGDKRVFIAMWIMYLLEEQLLHRGIPLGFTESEENLVENVRRSLLEADPSRGDLEFCDWREVLIRTRSSFSEPDRPSLEKKQLNARLGKIVADLSTVLPQVKEDSLSELTEGVLKPAYSLVQTMQSSLTAFHFARMKTNYGQDVNSQRVSAEELAKFTLRSLRSGKNVEIGDTTRVLHALYPALAVNDYGSANWETLVPPVILVDEPIPIPADVLSRIESK